MPSQKKEISEEIVKPKAERYAKPVKCPHCESTNAEKHLKSDDEYVWFTCECGIYYKRHKTTKEYIVP